MGKFILAVAMLVFVGGAHSQNEKTPPPNPKKASDSHKEPAKKTPSAPVGLDKGEAKKQEQANRQRDEDRKLQIELLEENKRLGSYTLWLAVFTFLLGSAAIWQAVITRNTAKRQLRAYIGIRPDPSQALLTLEEIHSKGFKFHVVNDGKTPAYNVTHVIKMGGYEKEEVFENNDFPTKGSKFVLNPDTISDLKISRNAPFSEAEKKYILEGKIHIFIWGEIRYVDAFGFRRWTRFKWRQDGGALHWTDEGNEAN